ncbi:sugar phosphate isomerase/epimerase family protein [Aestuariivivens sediminicola]|uniref:sugar phosphate isomerase/epimerase family protein n=1 Tax=Aestuariivivens sediminicola TaxID=2913560 RepID=UPI001F5837CF|nr:sugar phosphate isomerase/epimerase family protein [Aestuariivivens sediminicola]
MKLNRSTFTMTAIVLLLFTVVSCLKTNKKETTSNESEIEMVAIPDFKISLAQWSLHKAIRSGEMGPFDFAKEAHALGFSAIEYVSGLYKDQVESMGIDEVVKKLKAESEVHGVKNLLIMVDGEGNLASSKEEERQAAVENHKKWVDAAQVLGCHSIRVNANGDGSYDEVMAQAVMGLSALSEYAKPKNINVIVENHGGLTSNAQWLSSVIKKVNMSNCGSLPDFGNFCVKGSVHDCIEWYDKYKGVKELMPFAKAVSAKSYDFDEAGNEIRIDYERMINIVKGAGYTGYIGVEYEGDNLTEKEGILATKKLLEKLQ